MYREIVVRQGLPFIVPPLAAALLAATVRAYFLAALFFLFAVFVTWFFRNPKRVSPKGEHFVLSPADGRVIRIAETADSELAAGYFKKVSIFMSIFDVHVNRIPYSGTVSAIHYRKGKFFSADLDKASAQNERNTIVITTDKGRQLVTVQIAGLIARRIVCWLTQGMRVKKGAPFGLIRFGSRLEVFLPHDAVLAVKVGDRVQAGVTILGELP